MSVSDGIKEYLNDYYDGKWKRLNKVKQKSGAYFRDFECIVGPKKGNIITILASTEDDDCETFYEITNTTIYFAINTNHPDTETTEKIISFVDEDYWNKNHAIWDQHMTDRLSKILGLPSFCNNETMENCFVIWKNSTLTDSDIELELTALGYQRNAMVEQFLSRVYC